MYPKSDRSQSAVCMYPNEQGSFYSIHFKNSPAKVTSEYSLLTNLTLA